MANLFDLPCTEKCRSVQHGNEVCKLVENGTEDNIIASLINACVNYGHVKDIYGRTALHVAASFGKTKTVEWLIRREGSPINLKDLESGYTPLHRSLYKGHITTARTLIKLGADICIRDNEGLCPLDLIWNDRIPYRREVFREVSDPIDLYVWGRNDNFNLGIENHKGLTHPDILEKFGPENNTIKNIILQQFHTVFLSQAGNIYVCGHGKGGRLGTGDESAVLTPRKIQTAEVIAIAASINHTILVFSDGRVSTFGSNEFAVLGHYPQMEKVLVPKTVRFGANIVVIDTAASKFHSVFYSKNQVYVCGTNEGQFGHTSNQGTKLFKPIKIKIPMKENDATKKHCIIRVECSETATAILEGEQNRQIYLYTNFGLLFVKLGDIMFSKFFICGGLKAPCASSEKGLKSKQEANSTDEPILIVYMHNDGLFVWRQTLVTGVQRKTSGCPAIQHTKAEGKLTRIVFNVGRQLSIKDFWLSKTLLLIATNRGEAFHCPWNGSNSFIVDPDLMKNKRPLEDESQSSDFQFKVKQSSRKNKGAGAAEKTKFEVVKAKRIPLIYAAEKIYSDSPGHNFAVMQRNLRFEFYDYPWILTKGDNIVKDLNVLFCNCNESDILHDIVFLVQGKKFCAHKVVIAYTCIPLYDVVKEEVSRRQGEDGVVFVELENVDSIMFEQVLKFLYTMNCDLVQSSDGQLELPANCVDNWVRNSYEFARKFGLNEICLRLRHAEIRNCKLYIRESMGEKINELRLPYGFHMDLCDIVVQSDDGEKFPAHRCILASRVNYFSAMFEHPWMEAKSDKPISIFHPKKVVQILMEYIYTDNSPSIFSSDMDTLTDVLVLADKFFLARLGNLIEIEIGNRLSIKNIVDIFQLADTYKAPEIKVSCMQLIGVNMQQMLEARALDQLPKRAMKDLTTYFRSRFVRYRTPEDIDIDEHSSSDENSDDALKLLLPEIVQMLDDLEKGIDIPLKKSSGKSAKIKIRARTTSENEAELQSSPLSKSFEESGNSFSLTPVRTNSIDSVTEECNQEVKVTKGKRMLVPLPSFTTDHKKDANSKFKTDDFPCLTVLPGQSSMIKDEEQPCCSKSISKNCKALAVTTNSKSSDKAVGSQCASSNGKKKRKWRSLDNKEMTVPIQVAVVAAEAPANPWKKTWEEAKPTEVSSASGFKGIVQEEQDKKRNLEKAISKPMNLLMIEEAALSQLKKKYTSPDVINSIEFLTVDRVSPKNYAEPTWVCQQPK